MARCGFWEHYNLHVTIEKPELTHYIINSSEIIYEEPELTQQRQEVYNVICLDCGIQYRGTWRVLPHWALYRLWKALPPEHDSNGEDAYAWYGE